MNDIYKMSIPSITLQYAMPKIYLARLTESVASFQRASHSAIADYVTAINEISRISIRNSLNSMSKVMREHSMDYSALISSIMKTMNSVSIPRPLSTSEILRRQNMTYDEVQATNNPVSPPDFFSPDSDFYEKNFDKFEQNSDTNTATNHFQILLKHIVSILRFSGKSLLDEILSILVWSPIAHYSWVGFNSLIRWFLTFLN